MTGPDLTDRVVIVTGGARGQGAAECRQFVAAGARVLITDVLTEEGAELGRELGPRTAFVEHDISDEGAWARVAAHALATFGRIDVLVNNAAVHRRCALLDETAADVRRLLDVNLVGPMLGIRACAPSMRANGRGAIVNIASIAGWTGLPEQVAYGMTKWGLRGLTKTAAVELGPFGIRVNAVLPGRVDSPMLPRQVVAARDSGEVTSRIATADEVANVVTFLASDLANAITGIDVVVDGGQTLITGVAPLRDERAPSSPGVT